MVTLDQKVESQWAQVENVYQRRADLIPNLVNVAKGYMKHEKDILTELAEARSRYAGAPKGSPDKVQAANQMESVLSRLLVIVENYPNLKADRTMQSLMDELAGTENRISVERHRYNEIAKDFNTEILKFPGSLYASIFHFKKRAYFEAARGAEKAPEVKFE
ncbi:MAG: LemA family protein [Armatimonadetes bacterium]|nr:LemA family protein [Armatimonadota bacterium]